MNTLPLAGDQAAAPRPRAGVGTRLATVPGGYMYSVTAGGASYPHPFKVGIAGGGYPGDASAIGEMSRGRHVKLIGDRSGSTAWQRALC